MKESAHNEGGLELASWLCDRSPETSLHWGLHSRDHPDHDDDQADHDDDHDDHNDHDGHDDHIDYDDHSNDR